MTNQLIYMLLIAASLAPLTGCTRKYAQVGKIDAVDLELDRLIKLDARIEQLDAGFQWAEGPLWMKTGQYLLFTDIPPNRVLLWRQGKGEATVYLYPSGYTGSQPRGGEMGANGLALSPRGELVLCQHGDRRVAQYDPINKAFITLADNYDGKRFNSPNDLIYHSNGDLYFTDPPYGLVAGMNDPDKELSFQGVYLLRGGKPGGQVVLLTDQLSRPNGIAFSPDEKTLYVANSDPDKPIWMAYDVQADGTIGSARVFFDAAHLLKAGKQGLPDGMAADQLGNIWATGPGGVLVLSPAGKHLGTIDTTRKTANCAFGDEDGDVLYITAHDLLLRVKTKVAGLGFKRMD